MTPALFAACEKAVHVLTTDGRTLRAGRAALFILQTIGRWSLAARIFSLPPFIWLVELGYYLIARNRRFFARFLFTGDYDDDAAAPPQSR